MAPLSAVLDRGNVSFDDRRDLEEIPGGAAPTSELPEVYRSGLREALERRQDELSELAGELIAAGAPWIEGEPLP